MSNPISLFIPTAVIAAVSVPLALKLVPPNRFYGYRTAQTLADREVWFRVNRVAGASLVAAAFLTACVYLALPDLASGRSLAGVLTLGVPVIAALALTAAYARRLARGRP